MFWKTVVMKFNTSKICLIFVVSYASQKMKKRKCVAKVKMLCFTVPTSVVMLKYVQCMYIYHGKKRNQLNLWSWRVLKSHALAITPSGFQVGLFHYWTSLFWIQTRIFVVHQFHDFFLYLTFIHSKKATKFCKISTFVYSTYRQK